MATMGRVQVGKPAPPFENIAVLDGRLKKISLASYVEANHWLILVFFPKAWSFVCPTEIIAFNARHEEFLYSRSCAVVFASTDSEHCLKAWNSTSQMEGGLGDVHIPLISDSNHKLSRDFGVLLEEEGLAQRALFIIDPKGIVRSMTINDADVGRSVDEAQRILDALKFKDEFGEGCPIDWKKGDKGIDIKSPNKVEGAVEVSRKSWSEWARPKLQRAWSGTSGVSVASHTTVPFRSPDGSERNRSHSNLASRSHSQNLLSPGTKSPLIVFEQQMEEALIHQRMENLEYQNHQAAFQNQSIGVAT